MFLAAFKGRRPYLASAGRADDMVIATDRKQARTIFRYVKGFLAIPMLAPLIEREAAEAIDLTMPSRSDIAVASYLTTRGYTLAAVLCDELASWRSDDAAERTMRFSSALRPGPARCRCDAALYVVALCRNPGVVDAFRRDDSRATDASGVGLENADADHGAPDVSRRATIDVAMERDPANAAAEYMAEFRIDVQRCCGRSRGGRASRRHPCCAPLTAALDVEETDACFTVRDKSRDAFADARFEEPRR